MLGIELLSRKEALKSILKDKEVLRSGRGSRKEYNHQPIFKVPIIPEIK